MHKSVLQSDIDPMLAYNSLGVGKDATPQQIKEAYEKKAHENHPDKGGDEKLFNEISLSYGILSNPEEKAKYDKMLENGFNKFADEASEQHAASWINLIKFLHSPEGNEAVIELMIHKPGSLMYQLLSSSNETPEQIESMIKR